MVDVQSQDHIHNQSHNIQLKSLTTQSLCDAHAKATTLLQTHCANALTSALSKYADPESDEEYLEKLLDKSYDPKGDPLDPKSQMHLIGQNIRDLQEGLLSELKDAKTPEEKQAIMDRYANDFKAQEPVLASIFKQIAPDRDPDALAKQLITRYQDLGTYENSEKGDLPPIPTPPKGVVFVDWDQTLTQGSDYKARHGGDKEFSYQDQYLAHSPKYHLNPRLTEFLINNLKNGVVTHIVTANGNPGSIYDALGYALTKLGDKNPEYTAKKLFDSGMIRVTSVNHDGHYTPKGDEINTLIKQYYPNMSEDKMAFIDDQQGNLTDVQNKTHVKTYHASLNIAGSKDWDSRAKNASGMTAETGLDALNHILKGDSPSSGDDFSVMSFNARDERADYQEKNHQERWWNNSNLGNLDRHHRFVKQILDNKPAFVGLQELYSANKQRQDVVGDLTTNGGPYKEVSFKPAVQDDVLLYDPSKFTPTGDQGCISLGSDQYGPRSIVWAKFTDNKTGKSVMISSAHFPPDGDSWKLGNYQKVVEDGLKAARQKCGEDTPMILVGDYSRDPRLMQNLQAFTDLGLKSTYDKAPTVDAYNKPMDPVSRHGGRWTDDKNENWDLSKDDAHLDDGDLATGNIQVLKNHILDKPDPNFPQGLGLGPVYNSDHFAVETDYKI